MQRSTPNFSMHHSKYGLNAGKFFRRRFHRSFVPIVTGARRADAAQLDRDVRTSRNGCDPLAPNLKHFVLLPGVGSDAQRRADVVEHDRHVGKRPRQLGHFTSCG